jgi:hypothetical protein
MTYVLVCKYLIVISTCGAYATELSGEMYPYLQLPMSASFTFYNTFAYSSFVLIAKGSASLATSSLTKKRRP